MAKRRKIRTGAPDEGKAPEKLQINEKQLWLPLQHEALLTATDVINRLGRTPPSEPETLSYSFDAADGQLRLMLSERKDRDSARFEDEASRKAGIQHRNRHLNLRELIRQQFGCLQTT